MSVHTEMKSAVDGPPAGKKDLRLLVTCVASVSISTISVYNYAFPYKTQIKHMVFPPIRSSATANILSRTRLSHERHLPVYQPH